MQETNSNIRQSVERISNALTAFNCNLELVKDTWPAEDLVIWIDTWLDFYHKAPDNVRKTQILSLLAEDVERCLANEKELQKDSWSDGVPLNQPDTLLTPAIRRIQAI